LNGVVCDPSIEFHSADENVDEDRPPATELGRSIVGEKYTVGKAGEDTMENGCCFDGEGVADM
jgi:hypothetical protein